MTLYPFLPPTPPRLLRPLLLDQQNHKLEELVAEMKGAPESAAQVRVSPVRDAVLAYGICIFVVLVRCGNGTVREWYGTVMYGTVMVRYGDCTVR